MTKRGERACCSALSGVEWQGGNPLCYSVWDGRHRLRDCFCVMRRKKAKPVCVR